jgi:hypothetical protein
MNMRDFSSWACAVLALAACDEDRDLTDQSSQAVEAGTDRTDDLEAEDAGSSAPGMDAPAPADSARSDGGEPAEPPGLEGFLLVAELQEGEEAIHAFSLPDLTHTGSIDGLRLANHMGALVLEDGRVITADDAHQQIVAIELDASGVPRVSARVHADLGEGAVWGCADADLTYFVAASGREDSDEQVANIVALDDFSLTGFEVTLNSVDGATEELHPWIAGDPAHLLLGVGGEIEAYPLSDVLDGTAAAPVASVGVHAGAHGPVAWHAGGIVYFAAAAGTGLDGVALGPIARTKLIPWDVDGLSSGRNGRPRLSWDERYIYGAITRGEPAGDVHWAERVVDLHIADLQSARARRLPLTTGIVPKFQLSKRFALFANVTADADYALLVDVDADSPSFQEKVAQIELEPLREGPIAGEPTSGKQARASAITPDGKWAFVSHGGEGTVSVIDTARKQVVETLEIGSALSGGGYLLAIQPGTRPVDTCAR